MSKPKQKPNPSRDIQQALTRLFVQCGISWDETRGIDDWLTLGSIDDVTARIQTLQRAAYSSAEREARRAGA